MTCHGLLGGQKYTLTPTFNIGRSADPPDPAVLQPLWSNNDDDDDDDDGL